MPIKVSLAYGLQKCLGNHWTEKNFSDFTVIVESMSFKCHKVILNACSVFFQGLFRSNMSECRENRVHLHGVTKDAFAVIINSIYRGKDGLTVNNISDVWAATVQLDIGYLIAECENFVMNNLSVDNCCQLFYQAKIHSSIRVTNFILRFMYANFETIKYKESFLWLSGLDIYKVIQSDSLRTKSEDSVVDCILKWVQYVSQDGAISLEENTEERCGHVTKLLSAVRLCLVSQTCLRDLSIHKLVKSYPSVCDMIFEAMNYNSNVGYRHDAWPKAAIHRTLSEMKHAMVFVDSGKLMAYNLITNTLLEYAKLPNVSNADIVVFDNVLYLSCCKSLRMLTSEKTWENIMQYSFPKSHSLKKNILLSIGSYIYCYDICSHNLKRFSCIHGHVKKWEEFATGRIIPKSLVRFREYILMFSTENGQVFTECFDTVSEKFISVSPDNPIDGPSENLISFSDQTNVFILQKNGYLWKICPTDSSPVDFIFITSIWKYDWEIYGAVVFHKELFVFGEKYYKDIPDSFDWPDSSLGDFETIKTVHVNSDTQCLPMVLSLPQ